MKDSSGFFRLKESTGKKKNPDADCVGLPEEVCCRLHALRGPSLKTKSIEKKEASLAGEVRGQSGWALSGGENASLPNIWGMFSEKRNQSELPGGREARWGRKGFAKFYREGGVRKVESSLIASRADRL